MCNLWLRGRGRVTSFDAFLPYCSSVSMLLDLASLGCEELGIWNGYLDLVSKLRLLLMRLDRRHIVGFVNSGLFCFRLLALRAVILKDPIRGERIKRAKTKPICSGR